MAEVQFKKSVLTTDVNWNNLQRCGNCLMIHWGRHFCTLEDRIKMNPCLKRAMQGYFNGEYNEQYRKRR